MFWNSHLLDTAPLSFKSFFLSVYLNPHLPYSTPLSLIFFKVCFLTLIFWIISPIFLFSFDK